MLKRDLLIAASAAAISSLLTYQTVERGTDWNTPAGALGYASGGIEKKQDWRSAKPDSIPAEIGDQAPAAANAPKRASSQPQTEISAAERVYFHSRKEKELRETFAGLFEKESKPSGNPHAKIESRFYLEEWDQGWASGRENNILDLFSNNEALSDISPLQIACRSKNCQIVLAASNQDQVRTLSEKFMQAAAKSDLGMENKVVSFFPDISMGRLVFYLSENGNMDLFQ